jgi:uncharacterized membrane protein YfcA
VNPALELCVLGGSAFLAGAINSLAGGGTLLTYPALLLCGVPPVRANATSTLSLVQGQIASVVGFRRPLRGDRRLLVLLALPSLLGAVAGALLLLRGSERAFALIVPWLIVGATLLFLLSERLQRRVRDLPAATLTGRRLIGLLGLQLLVSIYGGFFGAGQSILMLGTLGLCGVADLDRRNGLKSFAAAIINGVAAALFIAGGAIVWRAAIVMALAAIPGGYAGAHLAQCIGGRTARRLVVLIGLAAAGVSFYKAFGAH